MTTKPRAKTEAMRNAAKINALLERGEFEGSDTVDIYRTESVGTASGMLHSDRLLGRLRFLPDGPDEFAVLRDGQTVGRIYRTQRETRRIEMPVPSLPGRVSTTVEVEHCWGAHDYRDAEFTMRGFLGYFESVPAAMAALLK